MSEPFAFDEWKQATAAAMDNPQPGHRFHEMFSYWVTVKARDGDHLWIEESWGAGKYRRAVTCDEFREMYAYKSMPGYSVMLYEDT